jgi:uncharacterized phage protein (TIGR02220 family)
VIIQEDLFGDLQAHVSYVPYKEIIDYLNVKAGTGYKDKTATTRTKINARWREGYRLPDFMRVIDTKVSHWKGNYDMEQYLRPETLFGTKFECYLNQKPKKSANKAECNKASTERTKKFLDSVNCESEIDRL